MDKMDITDFFDGESTYIPGVKWINRISLLTNLWKRFGLHPAKTLVDYLGDILEKYAGDRELTFGGLYRKYGTELCISVSNLSRRHSEYFHVTTTPNVQIKDAIRASMSIPIVFQPMEFNSDSYIDGGVFNNYPLKVSLSSLHSLCLTGSSTNTVFFCSSSGLRRLVPVNPQ